MLPCCGFDASGGRRDQRVFPVVADFFSSDPQGCGAGKIHFSIDGAVEDGETSSGIS
jgi:hypothetical protein